MARECAACGTVCTDAASICDCGYSLANPEKKDRKKIFFRELGLDLAIFAVAFGVTALLERSGVSTRRGTFAGGLLGVSTRIAIHFASRRR